LRCGQVFAAQLFPGLGKSNSRLSAAETSADDYSSYTRN